MTSTAPETTPPAGTAITPPAAATAAAGPVTTPAAPAAPAPPAAAEPPVPGEEALGDAGKQALDRMKQERKAAEDRAKAAEARAAELEAKVNGTEAEHQATVAQQQIQAEALDKAKAAVLNSAVQAAAAGKLQDPADALKHIDLSSFEVGDDFTTDPVAITAAITDLTTRKPYLAAQGGSGFTGSVDQGNRNGTPKSLGEQIADAEKAGDFRLSSSLKAKQLHDMSTSRTTT